MRQLEIPFSFSTDDPADDHHIRLGDALISYSVKRSGRRRSITLIVDERGLRVCAPERAREDAIESELRRHEAWIRRKHAEWSGRRPPPCLWRDGDRLLLLGDALRLTFAAGPEQVYRMDNRLVVATDRPVDSGSVAAQVGKWMRAQALDCFHARVRRYAPLLDLRQPALRISEARTRWGSCHAAGRVSLNWRLVQMPLRLLDYVVVHELAHLREMNHSPRFWAVVGDILPDYAARRREIRMDGPRYTVL